MTIGASQNITFSVNFRLATGMSLTARTISTMPFWPPSLWSNLGPMALQSRESQRSPVACCLW
jgi:hypothetical protein